MKYLALFLMALAVLAVFGDGTEQTPSIVNTPDNPAIMGPEVPSIGDPNDPRKKNKDRKNSTKNQGRRPKTHGHGTKESDWA